MKKYLLVVIVVSFLCSCSGSSDSKYFPEHFEKLRLDMTLADIQQMFPGGNTRDGSRYYVNIPNEYGFYQIAAEFYRNGLLSEIRLKNSDRGDYDFYEKLLSYARKKYGKSSYNSNHEGYTGYQKNITKWEFQKGKLSIMVGIEKRSNYGTQWEVKVK